MTKSSPKTKGLLAEALKACSEVARCCKERRACLYCLNRVQTSKLYLAEFEAADDATDAAQAAFRKCFARYIKSARTDSKQRTAANLAAKQRTNSAPPPPAA